MNDQPTTSLPTATDRRVVADAYGKLLKGEQLSKTDQAVLSRFEKEKEERLRWQFYRSIPKKHWRRMSGRQDKILNEQAKRYGLPLDGPTIDLPQFVAAFHDFLAENKQRLAQDDDPMLRAGSSPALERYREEKAKLATLDRLEREGELVLLSDMKNMLIPFCNTLRRMAERLGKYYGVDAMKMYIEAVDEAKQIVEEWMENEPEPFEALYEQQQQ